MDAAKNDLDMEMNHHDTQDHAPDDERNNHTTKDGFCMTLNYMNCKRIPKLMTTESAELATDHLNLFLAKYDMSLHCGPETIVTGQILDCNEHCICECSECVQAHHQNKPKKCDDRMEC